MNLSVENMLVVATFVLSAQAARQFLPIVFVFIWQKCLCVVVPRTLRHELVFAQRTSLLHIPDVKNLVYMRPAIISQSNIRTVVLQAGLLMVVLSHFSLIEVAAGLPSLGVLIGASVFLGSGIAQVWDMARTGVINPSITIWYIFAGLSQYWALKFALQTFI